MGVSILALLIALGGAGYSATGGTFLLGKINTASNQTRLIAPLGGAAFRVDNLSAVAKATGLAIITDATRPPLVINSSVKVTNLNADKLDGLDSTEFLQGPGVADGQAIALAPNTIAFLGPASGGLLRLRYSCPTNLGGNGTLRIINASTGPTNLFVDSGGANPDYYQLNSGGFVDYPAAAGGESFSIQIQGDPGIQTALVASVHRSGSNDCHAQALMMLAR
jgi:hypothetical protein